MKPQLRSLHPRMAEGLKTSITDGKMRDTIAQAEVPNVFMKHVQLSVNLEMLRTKLARSEEEFRRNSPKEQSIERVCVAVRIVLMRCPCHSWFLSSLPHLCENTHSLPSFGQSQYRQLKVLFSLITSGEHKGQVTREDGGDVFQLQISATGRRCACARLMLARTTILH